MNRTTIFAVVVVAAAGIGVYMLTAFTPAWLTALGEGIAKAEGFGIPGKIPTTHNNPGDVTDGNGNKLQFASVADGFRALYDNVLGAFRGTSQYYSPQMTLRDFAETWTGGDQASSWLATVLSVVNEQLGSALTPNNTLQDVAST